MNSIALVILNTIFNYRDIERHESFVESVLNSLLKMLYYEVLVPVGVKL